MENILRARAGLKSTIGSPVILIIKMLVLASLIPHALAQTSRGDVAGTVTDISGSVVAGAEISLTSAYTGVVRTTITNQVGIYRFDAVDLGAYTLKIIKAGFRPFISTEVGVAANRVTTINSELEVGTVETAIQVNAGAAELLTRDGPLRGGNIQGREVRRLPMSNLDPVSLARTLPGAIELPGTYLYSNYTEASFSVNGQRARANNYLLDGTENNDFVFTGIAQPFNIADAVEEVSVQTGNFNVEFGRAGGGIFNVVTKSGTNSLRGTLLWRYQSQLFNSVSNLDKMNHAPRTAFSQNVYGFTVGGPLRKRKTFFFGGFQQDARRSSPFRLVVPTGAAVGTLRTQFPSSPQLDLYLGLLADLRGKASPIPIQLGEDPAGVDRGVVQFATAPLAQSAYKGWPQWLLRLDHDLSEAHHLAGRYIYESYTASPVAVYFPGFVTYDNGRQQNFLFTDNYAFSPGWTNEFRFSYARQRFAYGQISPGSVAMAQTLPRIVIPSIDTPGIPFSFFQLANNLLFQEAQTKLHGRHTFRYGVEFLRQLAVLSPGAFREGQVNYTNASSAGYSGFANFLDDFSGPKGRWRRDFGATDVHPNQFRQTYFLQDTWLPKPLLSLTVGLRYENFGQVANAVRFAAFSGFDPEKFLIPNKVNTDNKDFGPAIGLAWSPTFPSGWLGTLFGQNRMVWRSGYQISYDAPFAQMVGELLATATPNAVSVDNFAPNIERGQFGWFEELPKGGQPPSLTDAQAGTLEKDFRNPYTERWSFGFQRQLSGKMVLDGSYIGSESHRLTTWADVNPPQLDGTRLHPDFGLRQIRISQGNSSYHAMQWRLDRRFSQGFQMNASYTWSKNLDSTSEGIGAVTNQDNQRYLTSVPVSQGGLKLDHGPSDFDRAHRFSFAYIWDIPSPAQHVLKRALGGWSISGITTFQSGAPFSVMNGFDRNNDGFANDRPDIGNPNAPLNSRALLAPTSGPHSCPTGYRNPDTGLCVTPADVHWVEAGLSLPDASTVGRNTLVAGGINNFDVSLSRAFLLGEQRRLEFRWEAFNALNHQQFTQTPERSLDSPHFLDRAFTDSGIRSMWMQLKFLF